MTNLQIKNLFRFGALFLVAVVAMSLLMRFIEARDAALPGAERFLREAQQIHDAAGEIQNISLNKLLHYQGIPGKEAPYREYGFGVAGNKAKVFVVIRAEEGANEKFTYRVVRLDRHT